MTQHIKNFLKDTYGLAAPGKGALDQHYDDLSHSYEVATVINSKGQEATFFVVTDQEDNRATQRLADMAAKYSAHRVLVQNPVRQG